MTPEEFERASMEPLFFKAENKLSFTLARVASIASMEPLFFKAENVDSGPFSVTSEGLQWSRFFSKRKIRCFRAPLSLTTPASMEPLFFKAENLHGPAGADLEGLASMEPLFFKAENRLRQEIVET